MCMFFVLCMFGYCNYCIKADKNIYIYNYKQNRNVELLKHEEHTRFLDVLDIDILNCCHFEHSMCFALFGNFEHMQFD